MERKVIQLVNANSILVALCDDGSVFKLAKNDRRPRDYEYAWIALPNVPQPEPKTVEVTGTNKSSGPVCINVERRSKDWVNGYVAALRGDDGANPYDVFNEGEFFDDWQQGYQEGKIDNEKRKGR